MEFLHLILDFVLHLDRHLVELLMRFDLWIYAIIFLVIFAGQWAMGKVVDSSVGCSIVDGR